MSPPLSTATARSRRPKPTPAPEVASSLDLDTVEMVDYALSAASLADQFGGLGREPQREWVARVAAFVSTVEAITSEHHGEVIGCLPAGVLTRHPAADVSDAINAAIDVQERVAAKHPCSIGIASGLVCTTAGGTLVGEPLVAAVRLCNAASAGAILVDRTTVSYANLSQLRSKAGLDEGRRPVDYVVGNNFLPLVSGIALEYSEILWDDHANGLDPAGVLDLVNREVPPGDPYLTGQVRSWDSGKDRGFVLADTGEYFYADDRFVVDHFPEALDPVVFVARPPAVKDKNRVAAALVVIGVEVPGDAALAEGKPVFVATDARGNRLVLPLGGHHLGPVTARVTIEQDGHLMAYPVL